MSLRLDITNKEFMLTKFGNWVFHYRNFLFPLFYAIMFVPSPAIFNNGYWAIGIGAFIIVLGMVVRAGTIGFVYITRGGSKRTIYAKKLVTEGVYSVCRNPMYLGNILLILGFAIFANSLYFLATMLPLFCLFYISIIKAEENFLTTTFPVDYQAYKADSNALLPKLSRLKSFSKGYKFNFVRVVKKEYNSTFMYITGMLMLLVYQKHISFLYFSIAFVVFLVIYLVVKYLKRRGKLNE
jgi:protein-S-isoprenylcysteine O-methyltransferase Ste14